MSLRYLQPEEKKMYMVVTFGAGSFIFGIVGDAFPVFGVVLFPLAVFCAVAFVFALVGPAEKLFPLRSFPRRTAPRLWAWVLSVLKALLFFGIPSLLLYLVSRALR